MVLFLQLTPTPLLSGLWDRGLIALCYLLMLQMFCRAHLETGMLKCPGRS